MSNKTQLATNNTQLASLIQTLQGKAAGGGGGNTKIYTIRDTTQMEDGDYTITYACPLDELDFFAMSMDKLTVLMGITDENITKVVDVMEIYKDSPNPVYIQAIGLYDGVDNASCIAVCMEMRGTVYPVFTVMVKYTPELIAKKGLSIEPGIYLMHKSDMSFACVYTGP